MSVGIRALTNRLSRYLAKVRVGKTITITDHGQPVALLVPLESESVLERLISEGKITPPLGPKQPAGQPLDVGSPVSDLLSIQRG